MHSNNWRTKREAGDSPAEHAIPPTRSWGRPSGIQYGMGNQDPWSSRASSTYEGNGRDSLYGVGRNLARSVHRSSSLNRRPNCTPTPSDNEAGQTFAQDRRVRVGNLSYEATMDDIQSFFVDISEVIWDISMPIDPATSKNHSYCFINFTTQEATTRAPKKYDGQTFMGRRLKVHAARWRRDDDNSRRGSSLTLPTQKRNERSDEFRNRDLYVRGLPKFPRKADRDQGILDLFEGFELETIGKLISPGSSVCEKPGNHHYCFVNLLRKEDIDRAIVALDGISRWGWNVIVSRPTGSGKLHRRQDVYVAGLPLFKDEKTLEIEMMDLFQQFGDIKVVSKILKKPFLVSNQKNRGYCYVEFADRAQADATVAALDQTERWDWRITVRLSNILKSKEGWRGDSKS